MSNYGLACMILDLVKKDFEGISLSGSRLKGPEKIASSGTRTPSGNKGVSGYSSGSGDSSGSGASVAAAYAGVVFSAKDDSGELIKCSDPGMPSLETKELSQIKIVKQDGGSDISFKYGNQVFGWNSHEEILGKGSFGEVKLFTLSDGKNVAIKKYPTWKVEKDKEKNIIEDINGLDDDYNEGAILKKIDEKCGPKEKEGDKCIRSCDIVPAHYIKSSIGEDYKFLINTEVPRISEDNDVNTHYSRIFLEKHPLYTWPKSMEYSFIAMEAMTGSLKKYSREQKMELELELASGDKNKIRKLLDEIFVNVTKIILKVAKILKCLSDKGYYYTDLKSRNVLYKCDGKNIIIKMGDIGGLTTKDDLKSGHYIRTYYDSQGNKEKSTNYTKWEENLKYYHVYLLGYLYIEILKDIFGLKFGEEDKSLQDYTKSQYKKKPNDEQIRKDIEIFMYRISTKIPKMEPKYNFTTFSYDALNCKSHPGTNSCIGEEFSVLINEVLHKTIVSQLELTEGRVDIEQAKATVNYLSDKNANPIELEQANYELNRTKLKHSFRYNDESELIRVLENGIAKINMRML